MNIRTIALTGVILALLPACTQQPVTEKGAAEAAIECFGWPHEIKDRASDLTRGNKPQAGIAFNFQHAQYVIVDSHGSCSRVTETKMVSNVLYHFPPSSFTEVVGDSKREGLYILFLISTDEKTGAREFVGMKGGKTWVVPQKGGEQPEQNTTREEAPDVERRT